MKRAMVSVLLLVITACGLKPQPASILGTVTSGQKKNAPSVEPTPAAVQTPVAVAADLPPAAPAVLEILKAEPELVEERPSRSGFPATTYSEQLSDLIKVNDRVRRDYFNLKPKPKIEPAPGTDW